MGGRTKLIADESFEDQIDNKLIFQESKELFYSNINKIIPLHKSQYIIVQNFTLQFTINDHGN